MKLGEVVIALRDDELGLADDFDAIADRHVDDAGVFHHLHQMAGVARQHADLLVAHASRHGRRVTSRGEPGRVDAAVATLRRAAGHVTGQHEASGVVLLQDLRHLHLAVSEVEIGWWIVRQGALVARDEPLLALFEQCHEESWNQIRWLKNRIKEAAPQVLG